MTEYKVNQGWIKAQPENVQKMVRAIRRKLTLADLADVARHGADAGWPGFTYYHETARFYARHKEAIWDLLWNDCQVYGSNIPALIGSFNISTATEFENLLVWFALETVARNIIEACD